MVPRHRAVNTGRVDPLGAEQVELEALDGAARPSALDHGLVQRLPALRVPAGLVAGVPQDDVSSLKCKTLSSIIIIASSKAQDFVILRSSMKDDRTKGLYDVSKRILQSPQ